MVRSTQKISRSTTFGNLDRSRNKSAKSYLLAGPVPAPVCGLHHKKENPKADTSALEVEIDQIAYESYGLTEEEIRIVEGS